jgi:predicted transcriptional regulator
MSLSPAQLEIVKVVWEPGAAAVRDVYEALRVRRAIAYTTVMTMMKMMEAKGHLKKRVEGRTYVDRAVEAQLRAVRRIVADFLDRVFNGAAEPLLVHLVEERRLSQKDLDEISRMIRERNNGVNSRFGEEHGASCLDSQFDRRQSSNRHSRVGRDSGGIPVRFRFTDLEAPRTQCYAGRKHDRIGGGQ